MHDSDRWVEPYTHTARDFALGHAREMRKGLEAQLRAASLRASTAIVDVAQSAMAHAGVVTVAVAAVATAPPPVGSSSSTAEVQEAYAGRFEGARGRPTDVVVASDDSLIPGRHHLVSPAWPGKYVVHSEDAIPSGAEGNSRGIHHPPGMSSHGSEVAWRQQRESSEGRHRLLDDRRDGQEDFAWSRRHLEFPNGVFHDGHRPHNEARQVPENVCLHPPARQSRSAERGDVAAATPSQSTSAALSSSSSTSSRSAARRRGALGELLPFDEESHEDTPPPPPHPTVDAPPPHVEDTAALGSGGRRPPPPPRRRHPSVGSRGGLPLNHDDELAEPPQPPWSRSHEWEGTAKGSSSSRPPRNWKGEQHHQHHWPRDARPLQPAARSSEAESDDSDETVEPPLSPSAAPSALLLSSATTTATSSPLVSTKHPPMRSCDAALLRPRDVVVVSGEPPHAKVGSSRPERSGIGSNSSSLMITHASADSDGPMALDLDDDVFDDPDETGEAYRRRWGLSADPKHESEVFLRRDSRRSAQQSAALRDTDDDDADDVSETENIYPPPAEELDGWHHDDERNHSDRALETKTTAPSAAPLQDNGDDGGASSSSIVGNNNSDDDDEATAANHKKFETTRRNRNSHHRDPRVGDRDGDGSSIATTGRKPNESRSLFGVRDARRPPPSTLIHRNTSSVAPRGSIPSENVAVDVGGNAASSTPPPHAAASLIIHQYSPRPPMSYDRVTLPPLARDSTTTHALRESATTATAPTLHEEKGRYGLSTTTTTATATVPRHVDSSVNPLLRSPMKHQQMLAGGSAGGVIRRPLGTRNERRPDEDDSMAADAAAAGGDVVGQHRAHLTTSSFPFLRRRSSGSGVPDWSSDEDLEDHHHRAHTGGDRQPNVQRAPAFASHRDRQSIGERISGDHVQPQHQPKRDEEGLTVRTAAVILAPSVAKQNETVATHGPPSSVEAEGRFEAPAPSVSVSSNSHPRRPVDGGSSQQGGVRREERDAFHSLVPAARTSTARRLSPPADNDAEESISNEDRSAAAADTAAASAGGVRGGGESGRRDDAPHSVPSAAARHPDGPHRTPPLSSLSVHVDADVATTAPAAGSAHRDPPSAAVVRRPLPPPAWSPPPVGTVGREEQDHQASVGTSMTLVDDDSRPLKTLPLISEGSSPLGETDGNQRQTAAAALWPNAASADGPADDERVRTELDVRPVPRHLGVVVPLPPPPLPEPRRVPTSKGEVDGPPAMRSLLLMTAFRPMPETDGLLADDQGDVRDHEDEAGREGEREGRGKVSSYVCDPAQFVSMRWLQLEIGRGDTDNDDVEDCLEAPSREAVGVCPSSSRRDGHHVNSRIQSAESVPHHRPQGEQNTAARWLAFGEDDDDGDVSAQHLGLGRRDIIATGNRPFESGRVPGARGGGDEWPRDSDGKADRTAANESRRATSTKRQQEPHTPTTELSTKHHFSNAAAPRIIDFGEVQRRSDALEAILLADDDGKLLPSSSRGTSDTRGSNADHHHDDAGEGAYEQRDDDGRQQRHPPAAFPTGGFTSRAADHGTRRPSSLASGILTSATQRSGSSNQKGPFRSWTAADTGRQSTSFQNEAGERHGEQPHDMSSTRVLFAPERSPIPPAASEAMARGTGRQQPSVPGGAAASARQASKSRSSTTAALRGMTTTVEKRGHDHPPPPQSRVASSRGESAAPSHLLRLLPVPKSNDGGSSDERHRRLTGAAMTGASLSKTAAAEAAAFRGSRGTPETVGRVTSAFPHRSVSAPHGRTAADDVRTTGVRAHPTTTLKRSASGEPIDRLNAVVRSDAVGTMTDPAVVAAVASSSALPGSRATVRATAATAAAGRYPRRSATAAAKAQRSVASQCNDEEGDSRAAMSLSHNMATNTDVVTMVVTADDPAAKESVPVANRKRNDPSPSSERRGRMSPGGRHVTTTTVAFGRTTTADDLLVSRVMRSAPPPVGPSATAPLPAAERRTIMTPHDWRRLAQLEAVRARKQRLVALGLIPFASQQHSPLAMEATTTMTTTTRWSPPTHRATSPGEGQGGAPPHLNPPVCATNRRNAALIDRSPTTGGESVVRIALSKKPIASLQIGHRASEIGANMLLRSPGLLGAADTTKGGHGEPICFTGGGSTSLQLIGGGAAHHYPFVAPHPVAFETVVALDDETLRQEYESGLRQLHDEVSRAGVVGRHLLRSSACSSRTTSRRGSVSSVHPPTASAGEECPVHHNGTASTTITSSTARKRHHRDDEDDSAATSSLHLRQSCVEPTDVGNQSSPMPEPQRDAPQAAPRRLTAIFPPETTRGRNANDVKNNNDDVENDGVATTATSRRRTHQALVPSGKGGVEFATTSSSPTAEKEQAPVATYPLLPRPSSANLPATRATERPPLAHGNGSFSSVRPFEEARRLVALDRVRLNTGEQRKRSLLAERDARLEKFRRSASRDELAI